MADDRAAAIVAMTLKPPHHAATHWTARAMAKAVGLAASTEQRIWKTHGLEPHRWRSFKLSNAPAFAEKLHAIVGLYVAPPAHAVVLSIDEKSQGQSLMARDFDRQVAELQVRIAVLNGYTALGIPITEPVG